jgi:hypothetical protein
MPAILPLLILLLFVFTLLPSLIFALAMVAALAATSLGNHDGTGWSEIAGHPTRLPRDVRETITWSAVTGTIAVVLEVSAITLQMRAPWKQLPNITDVLGAFGLVVCAIAMCTASTLLRRRSAKHWDWIARSLRVSRGGAIVSLAMFAIARLSPREAVASTLESVQRLNANPNAGAPQSWLWTLPVAAACLFAGWRVQAVTERYPCKPDA